MASREKRSEFWALGVSIQCVQGLSTVKCLRPFWVIRCISDFQQSCMLMAGPRAKHTPKSYVIEVYVVIVCHLDKQRVKAHGLLVGITWPHSKRTTFVVTQTMVNKRCKLKLFRICLLHRNI